MRLGIDAREIQNGVYTGIGRALVNFLQYFAAQHNDDHCVLFSYWRIPIDFGPRITNVLIPEVQTLIWDQIELPRALRKSKIDLFYSPYYKVPLWKSCTTVSAILDLMFLTFEPYRKRLSWVAKLYYSFAGQWYVNTADKILTCSEFSKKEIEHIYGAQDQKIKVIPLSVGTNYHRELNDKASEYPYLLYMGNFKLHKNVKNIVHAFALLAPQFPRLKLLLAAPKEHEYKELLSIVADHSIGSRVVFLGKITEEHEPHKLYSGAEVFVMPTMFEGFGLPLIEAMACGAPVVTSNVTSVPEVVGDAGIMVDPSQISDLAEAIKSILTNSFLREDLISKGYQRIKAYDANGIAAETYDFFRDTFNECKKSTT